MREETADKSVYFDTRTSGLQRVQEEKKKEGEWKRANENENPHTEVRKIEPACTKNYLVEALISAYTNLNRRIRPIMEIQ